MREKDRKRMEKRKTKTDEQIRERERKLGGLQLGKHDSQNQRLASRSVFLKLEGIQLFVQILPIARLGNADLSCRHKSPVSVLRLIEDGSAFTVQNQHTRFSRQTARKGFSRSCVEFVLGDFCCIVVVVCQRRFRWSGF